MDIAIFPSREIILQVGSFVIRWYGLMYVLALWGSVWMSQKVQKYRNLHLSSDTWIGIIVCVALGIFVGGRLGYVLWYEPIFFFHHPSEVIAFWNGGMASHGGILGAGITLWIASRIWKVSFYDLLDIATVSTFIGLGLGRIGNFTNQELFIGNWALGEAFLNVLLAGIAFFILKRWNLSSGILAGICGVLYSMERLCMDYVRIHQFPSIYGFTREQLLSIALLIMSAAFLYVLEEKKSYAKG